MPTWLKTAALITLCGCTTPALPNPQDAAIDHRGADVPFVSYEAEAPANRIQGAVVRMSGMPKGDASTPEMEASGRSYASLSAPHDFLEFVSLQDANTLLVRFCIPDAPTGGGMDATLSVYVNGKKRMALPLSSRHAWLYGKTGENGQSNDPSKGQAHVFWDEASSFIPGGIQRGDVVRLQKDETDKADFYRLDLIDLEAAPAPLEPPSAGTYLSVLDFGADGRDMKDDTEAIQACIAAAKQQGKIVWLPPGTYYQKGKFVLDGVSVRGAGMWHTHIIGTEEGKTWGGKVGFQLNGDGPAVADLCIDSAAHTSRSEGGKAFSGAANGWRIENVWIMHTLTGLWLEGSHGIMRGCRVRDTYADAINLNNGASENLIEQNHIRGCGDDGIAILSETERHKPLSTHNIVRFNTVSAIWWGHNCDIAGGTGHLIEDNIFADNARMGCMAINQPGAYPMNPLSDTVIRRNSMIRGGGNYAWQKRGAIWIYPGSTTISNVLFQDNLILNPIFRGIHLTGSHAQSTTFEGNVIDGPGEAAIHVDGEVMGAATLRGNVVRGLPQGAQAVENEAKAGFVLSQAGNSWQ